jgi:hypothetical protein
MHSAPSVTLANHTANRCAAQEAYMRPEKATAIVAGRSVATRVDGQWSITGQAAARLDRIGRDLRSARLFGVA